MRLTTMTSYDDLLDYIYRRHKHYIRHMTTAATDDIITYGVYSPPYYPYTIHRCIAGSNNFDEMAKCFSRSTIRFGSYVPRNALDPVRVEKLTSGPLLQNGFRGSPDISKTRGYDHDHHLFLKDLRESMLKEQKESLGCKCMVVDRI